MFVPGDGTQVSIVSLNRIMKNFQS